MILFSLLKLKGLKLEGRLIQLFPSTSTEIKEYKNFLEQFGSDRFLIVVIQAKDTESLKKGRNLFIEKIQKLKEVKEIHYKIDSKSDKKKAALLFIIGGSPTQLHAEIKKRLSFQYMVTTLREQKDYITRRELLSGFIIKKLQEDPLGIKSFILKETKNLTPIDPIDHSFISYDGKVALLFVESNIDTSKKDNVIKFLDKLIDIREKVKKVVGSGFSITFGGSYAYIYFYSKKLNKEINLLSLFAFFLVSALYYIAYRNLRITITIAIVLLTGITVTLGLSVVLYPYIHQLYIAAFLVLIGTGVDGALHIYNHHIHTPSHDLITTMKSTIKPITISYLTTIVSLSSLIIVSQLPLLKGIGTIAVLGMVIMYLTVVTLFPILLSIIIKGRKIPLRPSPILEGLASSIFSYNKIIIVIAILLIIPSIFIIPSIKVSTDLYSLLSSKLEPDTTKKLLKDKFNIEEGGGLFLVKGKKGEAEALLYKNDILYNTLYELKKKNKVTYIDSISQFLPAITTLEKNLKQIIPEKKSITQSFLEALKNVGFNIEPFQNTLEELKLIDNYKEFLKSYRINLDIIPAFASRYIRQKSDEITIATFAGIKDLKYVSKEIKKLKGVILTGYPVIKDRLSTILKKEIRKVTLFSLIMVFLSILLLTRNIKETVCIYTPLIGAFFLMLAMMKLLGISISISTLPVIPLIFGIGVDNYIYLWNYLHRKHNFVEKKLLASIKAVTVTSLTTISGLGILGFSSLNFLKEVGLLFTIGITISYIFSLFILPSIILSFNSSTIAKKRIVVETPPKNI